MDVGVRSSKDVYDPIGQGGLVTLGVPQNRRRKVVTPQTTVLKLIQIAFHFQDLSSHSS
jgi:hypothetical protein